MSDVSLQLTLNDFDPLGPLENPSGEATAVRRDILDDAIRGTVLNILKSYTGFYDLFSETIQNSLDATEKRWRAQRDGSYIPTLWIDINIADRIVRISDNGVGMTLEEFCLCFRPNVSFKRGDELRGNKGVGSSFLAYGFNYVHLQSRRGADRLSAVLRGGRQWAEDRTGKLPRPRLEVRPFEAPELDGTTSGTVVEIRLTGEGGEKPKHLGWSGATTAQQWFDVLRSSRRSAGHISGPHLTNPKSSCGSGTRLALSRTSRANPLKYFTHTKLKD